jgi:hypothetical protein
VLTLSVGRQSDCNADKLTLNTEHLLLHKDVKLNELNLNNSATGDVKFLNFRSQLKGVLCR